MDTQWLTDLKFASAAGVCVVLVLTNGDDLGHRGVREVDADEGWVAIGDPQTLADTTTRRRIFLSDITSLTITDVRCR